MKTLKDQLLKAGLVDKKKLKKVQHEKRVKQKKEGFKAQDKRERRKNSNIGREKKKKNDPSRNNQL